MFVRAIIRVVVLGMSIATFSVSLGRTAIAQVWSFLPGDSYFESELTRELVLKMQRDPVDQPVLLQYNAPRVAVSEHGGYRNLEIRSFSAKRRQLLAMLYKQTRAFEPPIFEITSDKGQEIRRELNGLHLLIYNKAFDYRLYSVGLRYNENWADEGSAFSIPRPFVNYYSLRRPVPDYIIEDWRSSKVVAPLQAVIPSFEHKTPRDLGGIPVEVQSKDIICIVVVHNLLEELRKGDSEYGFFVVEEERASQIFYGTEGWTRKEVTETDSDLELRK